MSQENVESLRRGLAAWRQGDTETLTLLMDQLLSPEFEIETLYFDGSYQGRDGLLQLWSALGESWDDYRFEIEELTDLGEHVLLVGRVRGRGSGSGVPIDQRVWVLWRFSGETAVHAKSFASRKEALEAAGLRKSAMSRDNVEVVRAAVDHYNATGELPWDMIDPEIEWVIDPAAFVAGTYRGHQGVRRLFGLMAEAFDRFQLEIDSYIDAGDWVVALGRSKVHGQRSGVTTGQPLGYTFRLRSGRIVAAQAYTQPRDALEAVGLRE